MRPVGMVAWIAVATYAVAQPPAPRPAPNSSTAAASREAAQQWLQRANYLNASILQDGTQLDKMQSLLLPARLAAVWAKSSHEAARSLAVQAADSVTRVPQNESDADRKARLEAASNMIANLNAADRASADRVIAMMSKDAETQAAGKQGPQRDTELSLAEAIRDTAKDDPARAYQLAQKLLALHDGDDLPGTYSDLRDGSPGLANQFLAQALEVARQDPTMLSGLADLAWNRANVPGDQNIPQQAYDAILQAVSDTLLQPVSNPQQRQLSCQVAPSALGILSSYPPAEQAVLRSAALACKGVSADIDKDIDYQQRRAGIASDSDTPVQSADPKQSAEKKLWATGIAEYQQDFDRALDIMDSFTPEEREAAYPNWHLRWISLAHHYIAVAEKKHDTATIQTVISRAPDAVRARVLVAAAQVAFAAKNTELGDALLGQTERDLESNPLTDQYAVYLQLLNLCAAHLPGDTVSALRLAVTGINNFKPEHPESVTTVGQWIDPADLDPGLLNADFDSVTATLAGINSPADGVAMRLGLLRLVLARYTDSLRPSPPIRPAPPKKTPKKKE